MNYHVISFEKFPNGGAAANRHMSLIKAIDELGHKVTLYTVMDKFSSVDISKALVVRQIAIPFMPNIIKCLITTFIFCFKKIPSFKKNEDKIIYFGHSGLIGLPVVFFSKIFKIDVFHERTELPTLMIGKSFANKLDYLIYKFYVLKGFKINFVISNKLKEFFVKEMGIDKDKVVILNMCVDISRFSPVNIVEVNENYHITFCGDLSSSKDSIDILVQAFQRVSKVLPNVILNIVGNYNNEYFKKEILPLIHQADYSKINLVGFVLPKLIPKLLQESHLLVLPRENNIQAQYGFPTKLGEYLASCIPTLTTNTSDISFFIQDKKNAFLISSGGEELLAEKIIEILKNYSDAITIGLLGRKCAEENFCSTKVAKVLIDYTIGD